MRKKRRDVANVAWETFAKTGQVGSYLLYRAVDVYKRQENDHA